MSILILVFQLDRLCALSYSCYTRMQPWLYYCVSCDCNSIFYCTGDDRDSGRIATPSRPKWIKPFEKKIDIFAFCSSRNSSVYFLMRLDGFLFRTLLISKSPRSRFCGRNTLCCCKAGILEHLEYFGQNSIALLICTGFLYARILAETNHLYFCRLLQKVDGMQCFFLRW